MAKKKTPVSDIPDGWELVEESPIPDGWEVVDPKKVDAYTTYAEALSRTPPLGLGEFAGASRIPAEDRDLFKDILAQQYATDQSMKAVGYGGRLATSAFQGAADFATPFVKMIADATGHVPALDPDQERFKQELIGIREGIDPTVRPDTNWLGRGVQQATRMAFPMLMSIGAGRLAGGTASMAGAGPLVTRAATALGTSGSFLPQIVDQTYTSLIAEGVPPEQARVITAVSAPIEAAIESIVPDPFKTQTGLFRGTVRQVTGRLLRHYTVNYTKELTEEGLQGVVNETALEVGRRMNEEIPNQGIGNIFVRGWEEMKGSALPLALMMGPGAAAHVAPGIIESAGRPERLEQLRAIREAKKKGFITAEEGRQFELTEEQNRSRSTRWKAAETLEREFEEIQDASPVQRPEEEVREGEGGPDVRGGREEPVRAEPEGEGAEAPEVPVGQYRREPREDEPPLAEGMIRLYHGSAEHGRYTGPAWFSRERDYAENYREGAELQYVDVPLDWAKENLDPEGQGYFSLTNIELKNDEFGPRKPIASEAPTTPPESLPAPTTEKPSEDPWVFQDSNQEVVIHAGWDRGNPFRYTLEGTGDVFRELTKDRPHRGYIEEKLKRLERQIAGERGGPEVMHRDDTREFSRQHNEGHFRELERLWNEQPTTSELQKLAVSLNLATIAGDWDQAESLVSRIRSGLEPSEAVPGAKKDRSIAMAESGEFAEEDRVSWTDKNGDELTGTITSIDPTDGRARIQVDQVESPGGVPVGRIVYRRLADLSKIKEARPDRDELREQIRRQMAEKFGKKTGKKKGPRKLKPGQQRALIPGTQSDIDRQDWVERQTRSLQETAEQGADPLDEEQVATLKKAVADAYAGKFDDVDEFRAPLEDEGIYPSYQSVARMLSERPQRRKPSKKESAAERTQKSRERVQSAKEAILKKLREEGRTLRSFPSVDPEWVPLIVEYASAQMELGVNKFREFVLSFQKDFGDDNTRQLSPALEEAWGLLPEFGFEGLDEAGSVAEIISKSPDASPLVKHFGDRMAAGESYENITKARQEASEILGTSVKAGTKLAKQVDEAVEQGIVQAARTLAEGKKPEAVYDALVDLYGRQPRLAVRTSTSLIQQAFSTPAPLAYLASRLAGVGRGNTVYDSSAGNGMLLIGTDVGNARANELNPGRAEAIRAQGIETTENDATEYRPDEQVDAVIINPPFGKLTEDGVPKKWDIDGFKTREIDHAIVMNSLPAMKDSGRAVLIIGSKGFETGKPKDDLRRAKAYLKQKRFYDRLYRQYNVVDHFTVSGDLYARQGASFPVDVIVIDGVGESARPVPYNYKEGGIPDVFNSWEELKDAKLTSMEPQGAKSSGVREGGGRGAGLGPVSDEAGQEGGRPGQSGGKPGEQAGTGVVGQRGDESAPVVEGGGVRGGQSDVRGTAVGTPQSEAGRLPDSGRKGRGGRGTRQSERLGSLDEVKAEVETDFQVAYIPESEAESVGTLVPKNQVSAVKQALARAVAEYGNLDAFVREELGYDDLTPYFSSEQVDALALMIANHKAGKAFILGDQTGVGKGRVAAAMMIYAKRNGMVPIFVTENSGLFADMIRDLTDIGQNTEANRFQFIATNTLARQGDKDTTLDLREVEGEGGRVIKQTGSTANKRIAQAVRNYLAGEGLTTKSRGKRTEHDAIFTTYSQLQPVNQELRPRHGHLDAIAGNALFILDESHNAGGAAQQQDPHQAPDEQELSRSQIVRNLLGKAAGQVFLSATYAKRSDVMDLYARTGMSDAVQGGANELAETMKQGGVPLQQVVSEMLVESGSYLRRERSYDGVEFSPEVVDVGLENADRAAETFRSINTFDTSAKPAKDAMEAYLVSQGIIVRDDPSTGDKGLTQIEFSSILWNLTDQMLLSLKAEKVGQAAVQAWKDGKVPVVAVDNTMEAALNHYLEDNPTEIGGAIGLTFRDLLTRYLERARQLTATTDTPVGHHVFDGATVIRETEGQVRRGPDRGAARYKYVIRLSDEQLGDGAVELFRRAQEVISSFDVNMPVSPIDKIRQVMRESGMRVAEVTGRSLMVQYESDGTATLQKRPAAEQGQAGKNNTVRSLNNGDLDGLVVNRSGATGLSIHASEKFKNQKQRKMLIAQAAKNIDEFMQMLGRIHRTGQVVKPAYSLFMSNAPAETRPASVLVKKLGSLNANVTASAKGNVSFEAPDVMNEVGDKIVSEWLADNDDIDLQLGGLAELKADGTAKVVQNIARKASGRMALMPVDVQQRFWDEVVESFTEEIAELDRLHRNPLVASVVPLEAETLESFVFFEGDQQSESPFKQPAQMERVNARVLGEAMKPEAIRKEIAKFYGEEVTPAVRDRWLRETTEQIREAAQEEMDRREERLTSDEAISRMRRTLASSSEFIVSALKGVAPGTQVRFHQAGSQPVTGIVLSVKARNERAMVARSGWRVRVAIASPERTYSDSLNRVNDQDTALGITTFSAGLAGEDAYAEFEKPFETTEERFIATGNLLAAAANLREEKGSIIFFSDDEGTTRRGVLMPRGFDAARWQEQRPVVFRDAGHVQRFLREGGTVHSPDFAIQISMNERGELQMRSPRSRQRSGQYTTDQSLLRAMGTDFVSVGAVMAATVNSSRAVQSISRVLEIGPLQTGMMKDVARRMEQGPRGVSGEASKPAGRGDFEPQPGTASGAMLQPVQMPELFQLARDLFSGKIQVKKLRGAAGRFKGQEGIGPLAILIDPTTAADEQALGQTLAHEIGHLIDFIPDNTMKRGNLLGRLQSLRNFLKTTVPPLEKNELARIRRMARKEAGPNASKEDVDAIARRMIQEMGLLANDTIRNELIELTKWWSGDYTGAKTSYVKYRESSRELYAEALSVFLNSPGELEARAPVFYEALLDNLDSKPDVLAAYSTLQQMLNGTGQELAESRTQTLRDMFGRAEEHIQHLRIAQEEQRKSVFSGILGSIGQYFLTSAQPVFTRLGRKPIKRREAADAEAARFAIDELFTIDSPNHTFLRQVDEQVYQPLIQSMEERGLDRKRAEAEANFTLGEYLYHWRVANERDAVANPAGFTATPSRAQLTAIRERIGDKAYRKLQRHARKFHDLVYAVAQEAAKEGVYNRQTFEEIITPNKDNYAAFRVTHHIDSPDMIATGVMQQIGTFSDIQNPFHATMLKVVRLNRLIELNRAKNRVRVFLQNNFPQDITPVETVFTGEGRPRIPKKRPGAKMQHLMELVDGRPVYFEVPSEIAKSFELHDIGGLGRYAVVMNSLAYKVYHPFFVTYSPGFVLANPFRDLRRTWVNLGAMEGVTLGKLLSEWAKALPVAVRREKGLEDDVIREMIDSHALDIPYTSIDAENIDSQVDALFQKHGLREKRKPALERIPVIGRVLELIAHAGAITETATKVAGWRVLEEKGVPIQERSYRVRKYVGTPDFKQRGLATALTNSTMMYSRVRWNGLQADISLATNSDTAAGWWWRQFVNVIVPTSLAKVAAYGGLGILIRALFGVSDDDEEESAAGKVATWTDEVGKRIATYFLTDYDVLPLGVNQDGKAVFITIPRDDLGKFIARTWWHMTDMAQLAAGGEIREAGTARDVAGSMFTDMKEELLPSFSPPIEITSKWLQYAAGINPIDSFYNQQIIPQKEWNAGGWSADSKMIAWTLDEFGAPGSIVHYAMSPVLGETYETGTSGGLEAVMSTAGAMTGLKRFLRVSNSGLTSEQWARLEHEDREAAVFRMSLPKAARDASTQRYYLMRREALGEELSAAERDEMHNLDLFYDAAYVPLRAQIQQAEAAGEDADGLRDDMRVAAENPMGLLRNPPDSIREEVRSYSSRILASATAPRPVRANYRTQEDYEERVAEFESTLGDREHRFLRMGYSLDEANQLLLEYAQEEGWIIYGDAHNDRLLRLGEIYRE